MKLKFASLFVLVFICCFLTACSPNVFPSFFAESYESKNNAFGLGLETNFDIALPEDGAKLFEVFATMGKDAQAYTVIQYEQDSAISDLFSWKPMDEEVWQRCQFLMDSMELWIKRNDKAPIPEDLRPAKTMMYSIAGDLHYPDAYVILLFSPEEMRLYVLEDLC